MSAAPMWAETSVRWLRDKHPEYVSSASKLPFPRQLSAALYRMSWSQYEMVNEAGLSMNAYKEMLSDEVACWTEEKHDLMRDFIDMGGYESLMLGKGTAPEPVEVAVTDSRGRVIGTESIELELDELERDLTPASQHSPEHELDEAVAAELLAQDPRAGVW